MIKTFTYTGCMVNHAVFDAHFHAHFLDRVCFHKGMHEKTASLTVHTVDSSPRKTYKFFIKIEALFDFKRLLTNSSSQCN